MRARPDPRLLAVALAAVVLPLSAGFATADPPAQGESEFVRVARKSLEAGYAEMTNREVASLLAGLAENDPKFGKDGFDTVLGNFAVAAAAGGASDIQVKAALTDAIQRAADLVRKSGSQAAKQRLAFLPGERTGGPGVAAVTTGGLPDSPPGADAPPNTVTFVDTSGSTYYWAVEGPKEPPGGSWPLIDDPMPRRDDSDLMTLGDFMVTEDDLQAVGPIEGPMEMPNAGIYYWALGESLSEARGGWYGAGGDPVPRTGTDSPPGAKTGGIGVAEVTPGGGYDTHGDPVSRTVTDPPRLDGITLDPSTYNSQIGQQEQFMPGGKYDVMVDSPPGARTGGIGVPEVTPGGGYAAPGDPVPQTVTRRPNLLASR